MQLLLRFFQIKYRWFSAWAIERECINNGFIRL